MSAVSEGKVILAGAGPGDSSLITLAALEAIRAADVLVYDHLVAPELLREAAEEAEMIYAGKQSGAGDTSQEEINRLLVARARAGKLVVRLKGGDPYIFGRGAEEACALEEAGIRFEIIPGITAATAASLYAGIPLTDRRFSATLTFAAGHTASARREADVNWRALAELGGTLVFYMGVRTMGDIAKRLAEAGMATATPAAVIENAAKPCQRTIVGSLGDIAERAAAARVAPPALLIVGQVVSLHPRLAWYQKLPLFGRKVAVTRATRRAENMAARLRALGAEVFEIPTIDIRVLELDAADVARLRSIASYQYLVLTSPSAVDVFFTRLLELGLDTRALAGVTVASVGEATGERLQGYGVIADLCPTEFVAEALLETLATRDLRGARFLLPRSGKARALLVEKLRQAGAVVDEIKTYEPFRPDTSRDSILEVLAARPDFISFTSSSIVENFVSILGKEEFERRRSAINAASIGPVTTRTLKRYGITPLVEAQPHTVAGLIQAMEAWARGHPPSTPKET